MRPTDDERYFREREAQEREAARQSSCVVRGVHEDLAELYATLAGKADRAKPKTAGQE